MANVEVKKLRIEAELVGGEKTKREIEQIQRVREKAQQKFNIDQTKQQRKASRERLRALDNELAAERNALNKHDRYLSSREKRVKARSHLAQIDQSQRIDNRGRVGYGSSYQKGVQVARPALSSKERGAIRKSFNSKFKRGSAVGLSEPRGTDKVLLSRKAAKEMFATKLGGKTVSHSPSTGYKDLTYASWWGDALGQRDQEAKARLQRGKWQQEAMMTRGRNSMKAYNKRQREQSSRKSGWKDTQKSLFDVRNSLGSVATVATQAVGELTMFAGALTMVGFMGASALQKLMQVGDAFAKSESDFLVTAGFRNSLIQKGGIPLAAQFDRVNALNQRYSGFNQFESGAMLARAATQVREMGGSVNEKTLGGLVTAAHGAAAITGDTADKTMSKILDIAKKGKGTDKLGIAELKLSKNMDANLEIIADAIKKDPIAGAILRRGTVASAMQRIRSAPGQLIGEVRGRHGEQVNRIFNRVGDAFMNAAKDPDVIREWSRVLTNMEEVVKLVFTDQRMKDAAMGASKWAAELVVIGGNLIIGLQWFLSNSSEIIQGVKKLAEVWFAITAVKFGVGLFKLGTDITNMFLSMDKMAVDFGLATKGVVSKMLGAVASVLAIAYDAYMGVKNADNWGVGKVNAGISAAIGGTSSGFIGASTNALKWGAAGAALGSFVPVIGTAAGGVIGAGFGAITGYVGGKSLAQSAHESMYGAPATPNNGYLPPIMQDGSLPGTGFSKSPTSFAPAYNNPNQKVFVIHGDVNVDSKLHLSEEWMINSAGVINN